MTAIFVHTHTVPPAEIDELGHVGNVRYLEWIVSAASAHSAAVGWSWPRYAELGSAWVVRRHELDYRRPAMEGDRVEVHTWISDIRAASSTRSYRVLRPADGATILEAKTLWAFIDLRRGVPTRIPKLVRDSFTIHEPSF